jgi:RNA polymerase sigma-70 factor (ECF subfamily)
LRKTMRSEPFEGEMTRKEKTRPNDLERYRLFLHVHARRRLGARLQRKLDAADLVQETLLQAYEKLWQFRGRTEQELAAWLRTILENTLAMAVRRFQASARDLARERSLPARLVETTAGRSVRVAVLLSPDEHALRQEQLQHLAEALRRLPRDQRRAIQLHHLEGQSLAEVAHTMQRSKQAVVGLLFRGLRRLRRLLIGRDEV